MILALSRWITRVFFREIIITGKENLDPAKNYIFTANHPNALLDPLILLLLNPPFHIRFVAKATLFSIPIFGTLLRRLGAIPVVRKFEADGAVDYSKFFQACLDAIKAGDSVAIFPEGRSLPQPFLAPMKTGPARLFFLATEAGSNVSLLPIGLNYERGTIFRSSVVVAVGEPLHSSVGMDAYRTNASSAVRQLTEELGAALANLLFQADSYRDRELLLLLEQLMAGQGAERWSARLPRLKQFEAALSRFRKTNPFEVERIRHLLARYHRIASTFGLQAAKTKERSPSAMARLAGVAGLVIAGAGVVFNWLPYRLVGKLVQWKAFDESDAATFKVLYSLAAFPLFYGVEALLIAQIAGAIASLIFVLLILPLTYFTLRFFEWREEELGNSGRMARWIGRNSIVKAERHLKRLESRILAEVDRLT